MKFRGWRCKIRLLQSNLLVRKGKYAPKDLRHVSEVRDNSGQGSSFQTFIYPLIMCITLSVSHILYFVSINAAPFHGFLFLFLYTFNYFIHIQRKMGLLDHMVILFLTFWVTNSFSQACTILHSHHQCTTFPISPYCRKNLVFSI